MAEDVVDEWAAYGDGRGGFEIEEPLFQCREVLAGLFTEDVEHGIAHEALVRTVWLKSAKQIRNLKHQIPNEFQISRLEITNVRVRRLTDCAGRLEHWDFGHWDSFEIWNLRFEI